MATTDYQQWLNIAKELGLAGEEMRKFVSERQNETREEKKERERMEVERERRQLEEEREKRQMEEEREKRQMEEEREKRQMEEEREKRQMELELKKLESEVKIKEVEARMTFDLRQTEEQRRTDFTGSQPIILENQNKGMQNIKFPIFNESKDDLDAYLLRFERTCEAYEVPQKLWSLTLARHLEGQALQVYQRLTTSEAKEYSCLKEQLLKRFQLTEGGYRRKFKESRIESGETPSQFIERLRRYVRQWISLAGYERTYEGLESLILKDQFFVTCSPDLRIFIKEKGKTSLKDMLTHAEAYIDAHGNKNSEIYSKAKPRFSYDKDRVSDEGTKAKLINAAKFQNENGWHGSANGSAGRFAERDVGKERMQAAEKGPICYICKMAGHKSYQCQSKSNGFAKHTVAAIQVHERSFMNIRKEQVMDDVTQNQESFESR